MGFAVVGNPKEAFMYYKDGKTFEDPEQAFHDLRLNWKEDFYLELFFDQSYQVLSFLGFWRTIHISKNPKFLIRIWKKS